MLKNKEPEQQLRHHLQALIEARQIQGADYCVSVEHRIVAKGSMGAVPPLTEIQSVTKMFTAVAILQLREKGRLRLTDPVAAYLPEFAGEPFSCITILHLLTHTSGLAALQDAFPERDLDWEADVDPSNVRDSWIPAILKKRFVLPAGQQMGIFQGGLLRAGRSHTANCRKESGRVHLGERHAPL